MIARKPKAPGPRPAPDEVSRSDPELAAFWANPAFRAAVEAARADPAGEVTLEEFEREHPLTEEQKAAADAWLEAYEQQLTREAKAGGGSAARVSANGAPAPPPKSTGAKRARRS
jgi:hypothetical protein